MTHLDPGPFVLFAFAAITEEPSDDVVATLAPPSSLPAVVQQRLNRLVRYYQQLAGGSTFALDAIMHELANLTLAPNYHQAIINRLSHTVMANHAREEQARHMLAPSERLAAGI